MNDLMRLLSNIDFAGTFAVVWSVLTIIIMITIYGCKAIGLYLLAAKTKQKHQWMAFVPVLQDIKVFTMAGLSMKTFIVFYGIYRALLSAKLEWGVFAPIWWAGVAVYAIGLLYARYQMARNFGCSQAICILNALFEPFVLLYIVAKKFPHQYTAQHPKVDHYLKAYGLYEDPMGFINPNATGQSIFDKKPTQAPQQPQEAPMQDNNWYQQTQQNPDMGYQMPQSEAYQNSPINIDTNKETGGININTDKE